MHVPWTCVVSGDGEPDRCRKRPSCSERYSALPSIASAVSYGSSTRRMCEPVDGTSWAIPIAPAEEIRCGLRSDSTVSNETRSPLGM